MVKSLSAQTFWTWTLEQLHVHLIQYNLFGRTIRQWVCYLFGRVRDCYEYPLPCSICMKVRAFWSGWRGTMPVFCAVVRVRGAHLWLLGTRSLAKILIPQYLTVMAICWFPNILRKLFTHKVTKITIWMQGTATSITHNHTFFPDRTTGSEKWKLTESFAELFTSAVCISLTQEINMEVKALKRSTWKV